MQMAVCESGLTQQGFVLPQNEQLVEVCCYESQGQTPAGDLG